MDVSASGKGDPVPQQATAESVLTVSAVTSVQLYGTHSVAGKMQAAPCCAGKGKNRQILKEKFLLWV